MATDPSELLGQEIQTSDKTGEVDHTLVGHFTVSLLENQIASSPVEAFNRLLQMAMEESVDMRRIAAESVDLLLVRKSGQAVLPAADQNKCRWLWGALMNDPSGLVNYEAQTSFYLRRKSKLKLLDTQTIEALNPHLQTELFDG